MKYQLINNITGEIAFTGTERECADFLKTYPTGEPALSFIPVPDQPVTTNQ